VAAERERTTGSFYSDADPPLQQGDVVAAPFARLQTDPDLLPPQWSAIDISREQFVLPDGLPETWAIGGWGWGMVISHDCHLDKEFNKLVRRLRDKQQLPMKEAEEIAESDGSLDRFVSVSPVLQVSAFPDQAADAALGNVIGLFHLPADETRDWEKHLVDLSYRATIDRKFIQDRRLVLAEEARMRLRFAIARAETFRSSEIGFQLEDVMDKRIRDVRQDPANELAVEIELWDGAVVRLVKQPAEPATGGPQRTETPSTAQ
jgi:hypothetical protein